MNFQSDDSTDYVGISNPTLPPAKYVNVELVSVKLERPTNSEGEQLKRRIIFQFKTEDGLTHNHTEYDIDSDDPKAESKAKNLVKRVGHIMSKFLPKEKLSQNNTTFGEYAKWIKETLGESYKGIKCDLLIVGNVYNGKASSGFPGYLPFIVRTGDTLGFDTNHIRSNKEYDAFMFSGSEIPVSTDPVTSSNTSTEEPDF